MFISIFGPDASGKSTHAKILATYFSSRGHDVKTVWIKSRHTLASVLTGIFARLQPQTIVRNPYGTVIRINAITNSRVTRSIWSLIEFISLVPVIISRAYLYLSKGRVLIADRYVVDSIASIAYSLGDIQYGSSLTAKILLRFIPKNSILIHLDASYEEISMRRGDKTDSREYLEFVRSVYNELSPKLGAVKIDTTQIRIPDAAQKIRQLALNSPRNEFL